MLPAVRWLEPLEMQRQLHQRPHAVAGAAGVLRGTLALDPGRAGDVQVRPRPAADELLQKLRPGDRPAVARARRVLQVGERTSSARPPELTTSDLNTPLGQALLYLHRNVVMDVSERAGGGAGGDVTREEASDNDGEDDLWNRLEREKLGRDPRAGTYARLLGQRLGDGGAEPLIDLLEAMRAEVPGMAWFVEGSTPGDQSGIYADTARLRGALGLARFTTLAEGMKPFVAWARGIVPAPARG